MFNFSVLNYPKTRVGKKKIFFFFLNFSVKNYPKSCAGDKKI